MRAWTVHLPPEGKRARPALLREGFAPFAFLFGPFWLFWHRCWLAGVAVLALDVALAFVPGPWGGALALAFAVLLGFHGRDLRRWTLERRGWRLAHVVLGPDEDGALARLFREEPRLMEAWR